MGAKRVNAADRCRRIAATALRLFLERPREEVTLALLAEETGMTYWQLVRAFGNAECTYRAAVSALINELAAAAKDAPSPAGAPADALRAYAVHAADVIGSEPYRQLLYFLIRDGCAHPWLADAYRDRVVQPLRAGLRETLAAAGERHGGILLLAPQAEERFIAGLEAALAAPKLLPVCAEAPAARRDAVIAAVSRELLSASYPLEAAPQAA